MKEELKKDNLDVHLGDLQSEKEAIDARIAHIDAFIGEEKYVHLPGEDVERLKHQREFMVKYSETLGERIRVFNPNSEVKAVAPHTPAN